MTSANTRARESRHREDCFRDGFVRGRRGSISDERPRVDKGLDDTLTQVAALLGIDEA